MTNLIDILLHGGYFYHMDSAIRIIQSHPFLLALSSKYYIAIIIDRTGRIVWAHDQDNSHYYNDAIQFILKESICRFYDVNPGHLKQVFSLIRSLQSSGPLHLSHMAAFPSRNIFETKFEDYNFVTELPLSQLRLIKISARFLLGIITFNDTIKNFLRWQHDWKNDINILVDSNDSILGYDGKFAGRCDNKIRLLNQPLKKFLNMNFRKKPVPLNEKMTAPEVIYKSKNRFCSAKTSPGPVFIKAAGLDLDKHNYWVEMTARCRSAEPPLCILNASEPIKGIYPDAYGLMLAPYQVKEGMAVFVLKWGGEIIAVYEKIRLQKDGLIRYAIIKYSRVLEIYVNSSLLGTYAYDILPQKVENKFVVFGCRAGQASEFSEIRITQFKKTLKTRSRPHAITHFYETPEEIFHVHSFYYPHDGSPVGLNYLRLEDLSAREKIARLASEYKRQQAEIERLKKGMLQKKGLDRIIGNSTVMIKVKTALKMAAQSDATVMLTGETGTGKSMIAEAIHEVGPRQDGPFVKVDCASLPQTLIESELFGFKKGAFTGAYADTPGKFEQADKGTLFLDEIANIPLPIQAKLLSVLQDRKIQRLGSNKTIPVDIRIISATNANLEKLVQSERFRSDLFYRLNVIALELPTLRQMTDDIPLFCDFLLTNEFVKYNHPVQSITRPAYEKLMAYTWPGNFRELYNILLKSILFCTQKQLKPEHIQIPGQKGIPEKRKKRLPLNTILDEIKACHGNIRWAADNLGLARFTLYNRLKNAGINLDQLRASA